MTMPLLHRRRVQQCYIVICAESGIIKKTYIVDVLFLHYTSKKGSIAIVFCTAAGPPPFVFLNVRGNIGDILEI